MRERTPAERVIEDEGNTALDLQDHPGWMLVVREVQRLKDAALQAVLAGIDHDVYRQKIGFISALDEVLRIPGELVEQRDEVRKSLNE